MADQEFTTKTTNINHTVLFYGAGVLMYCTRMFTRPSEGATDRLQTTVNQATLLFNKLADVLHAEKSNQ